MLLLLQVCFFFVMKDFMKSPSREDHGGVTEAFNSYSRYLDDLLNIDNIFD